MFFSVKLSHLPTLRRYCVGERPLRILKNLPNADWSEKCSCRVISERLMSEQASRWRAVRKRRSEI